MNFSSTLERCPPALDREVRTTTFASVILASLLLIVGSAMGSNRLRAQAFPEPELRNFEAAVQEQLTQLRQEFERAHAEDPSSPHTVQLMTTLGRHYLAYDLVEPAEPLVAAAYEALPTPAEPTPAMSEVAGELAYLLGYIYERLGQAERAEGVLQAALEHRNSDAPTLLRLGKVMLSRTAAAASAGQIESLFHRALAADPSCAAAHYGLGLAARLRDDHAEAARQFRLGLEQNSELDQIRYALGQSLRRLGERDEARAVLAEINTDASKLAGDSWHGCADPEITGLRYLATGSAIHLLRATLANLRGDQPKVITELQAALAMQPNSAEIHGRLASALLAQKDTDAAFDHFARAVELDPENAALRYDLGQLYLYRGETEAAEAEFSRALALEPGFVEPAWRLAESAARRQDFETTVRLTRQVLGLDPSHRSARTLLAMALDGLGRTADSIRELGILLDQHAPEDPREHLQLATQLAMLGDLDRAARHLDSIASQEALENDLRALAHTRAGLVDLHQGDAAAALERLLRAGALRLAEDAQRNLVERAFVPLPFETPVIERLGQMLDARTDLTVAQRLHCASVIAMSGDLETGQQQLRSIATGTGTAVERGTALARLGLIHAALGELDQAVENLTRALELDPAQAEARAALEKLQGS